MMISNLPSDLIEQILFRVPAISLGRSRFTCKRWNALVDDPIFIKNHFDKAARQSLTVWVMNDRVYSTSFNLHGIYNNVDPFIEFPRKLSLMDSRSNSEVYIFEVSHCDGLLLCITKKNKRLVVWNPCTGQTMWLKPRNPSKRYFDMYALGYAKNKLCHNYKILMRFNNYGSTGRLMGIYEFCSNSWRVLDDDFPPNCIIRSSDVSLKGNTYWIALSQNKQVNEYLLLSFDFSTERFRCLYFPFQNGAFASVDLSLAIFREQLSVLHWIPHTKDMEIWVSTKIETTNLAWSKFLKVCFFNASYFSHSSGGSLFINYYKKAVVCYKKNSSFTGNLVQIIGEEEDKFREISLGESTDCISWGNTFNYVPSLVRFQEGIVTSGHKRKRS